HVGYVHVTMGRIGPAKAATAVSAMSAPAAAKPLSTTPSEPKPAAAQAPAIPPSARPPASHPTAPRAQQATVVPQAHVFGVGALVGYTSSFGATLRAWQGKHFGAQFSVTRNTVTSDTSADSVTSTQFEPSFIYGIRDRVTDYVWLRPYAGAS